MGDSNAALYATGFLKFTKRIRSIGSKKTLNKVLRWGLRPRFAAWPPPCMAREKALEHNKNMIILERFTAGLPAADALWIRANVVAAPVVRPFGED